jgi:hypothetical protein
MKCEDCQKVLEEYFDGELDERASVEVRTHLGSCEACARELEALKDEQSLYAVYRRDVEVTPALWAGVAARIHEEAGAVKQSRASAWRDRLRAMFGTPRLSPALTFALLILAVGATAGIMKYVNSRETSNQTGTQPIAQKQPATKQTAPAPAPPKANDPQDNNAGDKEASAVEDGEEHVVKQNERGEERLPSPAYRTADRFEGRRAAAVPAVGYPYEDSPEQLVREAEQKYMAAIALLSRDAKRRRTLLEPDVRARFEQTLSAVDRTISETRRAARQQPDDPVAVQYMLAAYAKKVEVLREMATYRVYDRDIQ